MSTQVLSTPPTAKLPTVAAPRNASSKPALCAKEILMNARMKLEIRTRVVPKETAMMMYAPWSVSVTAANGG